MIADDGRLAAGAAFTLEEVLQATRGELVACGSRLAVRGVTTDSRTVAPGELFVALRGERHDGHAHLDDAMARGAGAVLAERRAFDRAPPAGTIVVGDTLRALGDLGAFHRRRVGARVVAVTGSNGKTTTKELLAGILAAVLGPDAVLATRGTQNNLVGVPLTVLRIATEAVAVVEAGMNGFGEIWRLAEIAAPDVGVVTCVAAAHLEGVGGTIEGVAEAKGELFRRLRPSATAVYNADDARVAARAGTHPGRRLGFGIGADAAVRAVDLDDRGLEGTTFRLGFGGTTVPVHLPLPGRHNVTNALAAAAAGLALGLELAPIGEALAATHGPAMRMEVHRLPSGVLLVNDAYNANPGSMAAALATLAATPAGRRVAVLGDMRELGDAAASAHRDLGAAAARAGVDALFVLGAHAGDVVAGAAAAGVPPARLVVRDDHDALGAALRSYCRAGDVVLVKGSRGSAMERVAAHLQAGEG